MISPPLACTVRGCALPLARHERSFTCAAGHAFDIARSGYVNLLQPQDRRSRHAGDSPAALDARARLLASGIGAAILEHFIARATALLIRESSVIVELGAGEGDALAGVASAHPVIAIGIDISTTAGDRAARRHPGPAWVVANADRRLPLLDGSVDLVLSLNARRNPVECARVIAPGGSLLVAVPAHDDLRELREAIYGVWSERDRTDQVMQDHAAHFAVADRFTVREQHTLSREALVDLLRGTYRGERASASDRVRALERLEVTLASEFLVFARNTSGRTRAAECRAAAEPSRLLERAGLKTRPYET